MRPVLHHDWTRRFFSHLPADPASHEHVGQPYAVPGTTIDALLSTPEGLESTVLVARSSDGRTPRAPALWHGPQRIRLETFYGLVGPRFQRITTTSFPLLLSRITHFFIVRPEAEPRYLIPLPQFARLGVTPGVLEQVVDAPISVPEEGLFARAAYVPSLRIYSTYDGARYGHSSRKLFYDHHGRPVPVELVAREVLARLGYDVVPPRVLPRLFAAYTGQTASSFRPEAWFDPRRHIRLSPLDRVRRIRDALSTLADGPEALVREAERRQSARFGSKGLALLARLSGTGPGKLEALLEALTPRRLSALFRGILAGYEVANADWLAFRAASHRAFPCEVKSRGDHLRPTQKEAILFCQRSSLLDYRLLEILHNRPSAGALADVAIRRTSGPELARSA